MEKYRQRVDNRSKTQWVMKRIRRNKVIDNHKTATTAFILPTESVITMRIYNYAVFS